MGKTQALFDRISIRLNDNSEVAYTFWATLYTRRSQVMIRSRLFSLYLHANRATDSRRITASRLCVIMACNRRHRKIRPIAIATTAHRPIKPRKDESRHYLFHRDRRYSGAPLPTFGFMPRVYHFTRYWRDMQGRIQSTERQNTAEQFLNLTLTLTQPEIVSSSRLSVT